MLCKTAFKKGSHQDYAEKLPKCNGWERLARLPTKRRSLQQLLLIGMVLIQSGCQGHFFWPDNGSVAMECIGIFIISAQHLKCLHATAAVNVAPVVEASFDSESCCRLLTVS